MNILGIDFEDWYHLELIKKNIEIDDKIPKVVKGLDKILDWLKDNQTNATFFIVGELIIHDSSILDKILKNGHEIAFHTMKHSRLDSYGSPDDFENELIEFKKLTSGKSKGFRAPTFSLNHSSSWVIDLLEKYEYRYDSSVVPAKTSMYGIPNAETYPYKISSKNLENHNDTSKIWEFPLLVTKFFGKTIPAGGGFYLRTLPQRIIKKAIEKNESNKIPSTFYIHSWELTPEFMPRINLPKKDNFITYHNLDKALERMTDLIQNYKFTSFEKYFEINN